MCRVYGVSRHGYNAWRRRGTSARREQDGELFILINQIFEKHNGNYGSPKITRELRKKGVRIGQKRTARIMREYGLKARKARIYKSDPGRYKRLHGVPFRLDDIELTRPNQLWVGDVTYLQLSDGEWLYLSVVMDRYSRRIISWSLSDTRDAKLTISSIEQAIRNRGMNHPNLVFHSDRGIEYLAKGYRKRLKDYGITQSMNRARKMNDNAFMESFFHQFKTERIKRREIKTAGEMRGIISGYMRYYNYQRSHSSIGYLSPDEFECKMAA